MEKQGETFLKSSSDREFLRPRGFYETATEADQGQQSRLPEHHTKLRLPPQGADPGAGPTVLRERREAQADFLWG